MKTQCIQERLDFHDLDGREIRADFNGGQISSHGQFVLIRELKLGKVF